jgi:acyl carrier protein
MAAALGSREQARFANQGVELIKAEEGLEVLGNLLNEKIAQVGVFPVNWAKFSEQFSAGTNLVFLEAFQTKLPRKTLQKPEFVERLQAAPTQERRNLLVNHLRGELAKVLGVNPAEISLQKGFFDLGMDSLMAVELRTRLQNSLGCSLPSSLAFDYPTGEALADYLIGEALKIEFEESKIVEPAESSPIEELSEAEVAQLLAQELQFIEEEQS